MDGTHRKTFSTAPLSQTQRWLITFTSLKTGPLHMIWNTHRHVRTQARLHTWCTDLLLCTFPKPVVTRPYRPHQTAALVIICAPISQTVLSKWNIFNWFPTVPMTVHTINICVLSLFSCFMIQSLALSKSLSRSDHISVFAFYNRKPAVRFPMLTILNLTSEVLTCALG